MKPLISVVMPVWNEAACLERTLRSVLCQTMADRLEFLLIDGGSTDDSVRIIAQYAAADSRVRLLHNPQRKTPSAFNIGLRESRGEYVCILGAHAEYPENYIATCYTELIAHDAAGCSGTLTTGTPNRETSARLVAACLAHPFASSGSSVRTRKAGLADTVAFPVFRKRALVEVGGYDERLVRNQDNDMNYRLRERGYKLYVTDKVTATYHSRPSVSSLLRHAFLTGKWNALTLRYNSRCLRLRHFVPFAFVAFVGATMALALTAFVTGRDVSVPAALLALVLGLHLSAGVFAGVQCAIRERDPWLLLVPFVVLTFHISYGCGTAAGLVCAPLAINSNCSPSSAAGEVASPGSFV